MLLHRSNQSNTSFTCSLLLHVAVLIILSALLVHSRGNNRILLDAAVSSSEELETDLTLSIEIPAESDYVNLDSSDLETKFDDVLETSDEQVLDMTGLVDFSDLRKLAVFDSGAGETLQELPGGRSGFFGIEATGNRIVYLIDMSPSMAEGEYGRRFDRAVEEVFARLICSVESSNFMSIYFLSEMSR